MYILLIIINLDGLNCSLSVILENQHKCTWLKCYFWNNAVITGRYTYLDYKWMPYGTHITLAEYSNYVNVLQVQWMRKPWQ